MPGTHAAATVTVPTAFTEVDIACTDGTSYTLVVPAPNSSGYQTNNQVYTIAANDNSTQTSNVYSVTNPGCSNGAPGHTTGTYFFALGKSNPGAGNPGLAGFSTTNGLPASGVTDPINVTFNLADSTTSQGGTWAPWTTLNWHNPYSCNPPGCPLTPTITWPAPTTMLSGTPSDLRAVECNGVVHAACRVYRPRYQRLVNYGADHGHVELQSARRNGAEPWHEYANGDLHSDQRHHANHNSRQTLTKPTLSRLRRCRSSSVQ